MRTVIFFLYLLFGTLARLPQVWRLKRLKKSLSPEAMYAEAHVVASGWARGMLKWAGTRAEVSGLENVPKDGAVLFVSNHQSDFDIALLLAYSPRTIGFVAKVSIEKIPIVRTAMRYMGCVFMDRDDPRQSLQTILAGIEALKGGQSLVVFPEGTRSRGGPVAEFKAGSFKLATKSGAAVVPVTVEGTHHIMEANGGRVKRADTRLVFHPAIAVKDLTREEQAGLHTRVYDTVCAALIDTPKGGGEHAPAD